MPEFADAEYFGVSGHLAHISELAAIQRALQELGGEFDAMVSLGGESFLVYSSMPLNHFRDSLKGPVNLLTTDDERGCDANHPVMGFLAQNPFPLERLAVGARRTAQFNADPQASAADLFQI